MEENKNKELQEDTQAVVENQEETKSNLDFSCALVYRNYGRKETEKSEHKLESQK